jgi:hypothetical protein
MPQGPLGTPRQGKTKVTNHTQPATSPMMETPTTLMDTTQHTLAQLKRTILLEGGLIKNVTNTRKYLNTMGLTPQDTMITTSSCIEILLTLVATSSMKRTDNEKIPKKTMNIIKATALLLDEITTNAQDPKSKSTDRNTTTISHENMPNNLVIQEIRNQMETNLNILKHAANGQAEATDKANTLLVRMEKIWKQTEKSLNKALNTTREVTKSTTPYRDTLVNGQNNMIPHTPSQQRILNHPYAVLKAG